MNGNGGEPAVSAEASVDRAASKRSVIAALALLVLVLAVAGIAYGALANTPTSESTATAGAASTGGQSGAAAGQPQHDELYLADFDSTVYADSGEATTLTKIANGKPLVVNFWATWCPYCLQEMGDFQSIYDEYSDRVSFAFVDATDGSRETVEGARAWIAESGYQLPFYFDTSREAVSAFGIRSFPTTVVVDGQGCIMTISAGVIDPTLMRDALDSLL